ncbi:MAG TPA: hypothetical protein VFI11_01070 [Anaerolineales bacterium]|nr:hypothetical protein [Anaerolineales bacterium]
MPRSHRRTILAATLAALVVGACGSAGSPARAVEAYLEALIRKDEIGAANLACADWEAQARAEALSFDAVEVQLEDVACQSGEASGESARVTCTGRILANYGTEDQEIDLSARAFRVVREAGQWLMCGYE